TLLELTFDCGGRANASWSSDAFISDRSLAEHPALAERRSCFIETSCVCRCASTGSLQMDARRAVHSLGRLGFLPPLLPHRLRALAGRFACRSGPARLLGRRRLCDRLVLRALRSPRAPPCGRCAVLDGLGRTARTSAHGRRARSLRRTART